MILNHAGFRVPLFSVLLLYPFHNQNSCCRPDQSSTIKTVALRTFARRAPFHSVACSHQFWNLLMSLFSFQGAASDLSRSDLSAPCFHQALRSALKDLVGQSGLEPPTSRLSVVCSSQLSYWPLLVEVTGLEPVTPCLQSRCSTS